MFIESPFWHVSPRVNEPEIIKVIKLIKLIKIRIKDLEIIDREKESQSGSRRENSSWKG